ncbi:MAG: hypothetical protein COA84_13620 [Robiginitomaculum sp.]|nr:MAG: hypothetical protein COA84_13620 [Robiginitomaculum sp.]
MHTTTGIITYEPRRNLKGGSKWWLTVELPYFFGTMDYYRWLIDTNWVDADSRSMKRAYHRPSHPPHLSINRGEEPRANGEDWGKFMAGRKVKVHYSNLIRQTSRRIDGKDHFWFIDAEIEDYVKLRKHFGLRYDYKGVPFKGHITVARAY